MSDDVPSLSDFEQWLKDKVKKNGDKLLPSTIERYTDFAEPLFTLGERIKDREVVIPIAQKMVGQNTVMYFTIKNLFAFLEYPVGSISLIKAPMVRAKAVNSRRFLQSRVMSRNELSKVFNEITDPTLNLAVRVLYDTACRRAELMSIQWKDIDWKNPKKRKGDVEFIAQGIYAEIRIRGKGNKIRTVYLGKETADIIKNHHLNVKYWHKDDYLIRFMNKTTGAPVQEQANKLYKLIVKQTDKILGRHLSPHCYRHSRATAMADQGADILDIASYLGHSSIVTTRIYVELSSFRARRAFALYSKPIE